MRYSKILLVLLLLVTFFATFFHSNEYYKEIKSTEQNLSAIFSNRIQGTITQVLADAKTLDEIFQLFRYDVSESQFYDLAKIIFQPNYFLVIAYQPQGIIKYVFPKKEYESLLRINVLEDQETKKKASYAKISGEAVLSGPYKIGINEGFVARRPIYAQENGKKKFWGFIAIGFDVTKLLDDLIEVEALTSFDFQYAIDTDYEGSYIPIVYSRKFNKDMASKQHFTVGSQNWVFYLFDANKVKNLTISTASYAIFYLFITFVSYLLFRSLEKKSLKAKKLYYKDSLTSAYNRKILDEYFSKHEQDVKCGLNLFFLDLNDFKPVNDEYGHEIGDKLLIAFVERIRHNFKSDTIMVRMGGDEFVIILNEQISDNQRDEIINRIDALSKRTFHFDGVKVRISASIGHAQYPKDGQDMQTLLAKADERMYAWKKEVKAQKKLKNI